MSHNFEQPLPIYFNPCVYLLERHHIPNSDMCIVPDFKTSKLAVLKDTIRIFDVMEGVISFLEVFITNYQKKFHPIREGYSPLS